MSLDLGEISGKFEVTGLDVLVREANKYITDKQQQKNV